MSRTRILVACVAGAAAVVGIVPVLASTAIGASEIVVEMLTTGRIRGSTEIDFGATGNVEIETREAIGASGGSIRLEAADGTPPLIGPFSPAGGGSVFLVGGVGSVEAGGASGGAGGDVYLSAGAGGNDGGAGSTGATGSGGSIFLVPGLAGAELGGGGGNGEEGEIILANATANTELTVGTDRVEIERMLLLSVRSDTPTCDASRHGSLYVHTNFEAPDGLCACLDDGFGNFQWSDLTGSVGC